MIFNELYTTLRDLYHLLKEVGYSSLTGMDQESCNKFNIYSESISSLVLLDYFDDEPYVYAVYLMQNIQHDTIRKLIAIN